MDLFHFTNWALVGETLREVSGNIPEGRGARIGRGKTVFWGRQTQSPCYSCSKGGVVLICFSGVVEHERKQERRLEYIDMGKGEKRPD